MSHAPAATASARPPGTPAGGPPRRRTPATVAAATLHLLLSLPITIVAFVLTVVLGAVGLGLLVIYPVGVLLLGAWLGVVRGLAAFERGRVRALLGFAVTTPPAPGSVDPATSKGAASAHRRLWRLVGHRTTWRAVACHLLRLPLGAVGFAVTVAAWALPLALLMLPLSLVGAEVADNRMLVLLPGVLGPLLGLALMPLAAAVVDALASLDAAVVSSLLGVSQADRREHRIEQLHATRTDLADLAEQERRRIERDLHDGAGQQLVSLAMTLGMAREKLDGDPDRARALLDEAHAEAKQALVGLREIVRGISPAILTDRGLGAALSAVAARSVVPVSLVVDVAGRPDPTTEGIAYYVVCEAIGNATRHAAATQVHVGIVRRGDVLDIEVRDDGRGGADPSRGTGLRGLAARVAAVDGELDVTSPPGGPTIVRARLPIRAISPAPAPRATPPAPAPRATPPAPAPRATAQTPPDAVDR